MVNGTLWVCAGLAFLWSIGACLYLTLLPAPLCSLLMIGYLAAMGYGVRRLSNGSQIRGMIAGAAVLLFCVSLLLRPSNERDWVDLQQRLPIVRIDDDTVTIENFRACRYRSETDYDVHFEDRTFDLHSIESVWFIIQRFSVIDGMAHTFLSFGYRDQLDRPQYFSVSVEIRREQGEVFSPIKGLYRQFELMHVVGDERDLIGSRTVVRPQDRVYLYRLEMAPEQAQDLFSQFATQMQKLETEPEFYNTLTNNCTNSIVRATYALTVDRINWMNPRIAMPGHSASFAFDHGFVGQKANGQTLEELYHQARIDPIARAVGFADDFSIAIRRAHKP